MIDQIVDVNVEDGEVFLNIALEFELGEIHTVFMLDIIGVMRKLAERTDSKVDDNLVDMLERALGD